ncbi:Olfactory Receptor 14C36 [Manis pentadactyla]|nr:Olfactory Receptor 14C36 [Manis pentadactyla]
MANSTMVAEVSLTGFADERHLRLLLSVLFLLIYLATLLGNLLIVSATTLDQSLRKPMYFFLRNLSILDMCYVSVTVPKACVNSLTDNRAISVTGCAAQVFLVIYCVYVELLFLTIMARDRYVAICQSLHYPVIMNHQFCVWTTLVSLLSGLIYAGVHTGNTFRLSFCQSNVVHQFFCDVPSLLSLSCSDTFNNFLLLIVSAILVAGGSFIFITISYIYIFSTVMKFPTRERGKAFSTCVPHILVVSVFLSSASFVYLRPSGASDILQGVILTVFYTIVPPFLNPIIYSLRNTQIKHHFQKMASFTTVTEFLLKGFAEKWETRLLLSLLFLLMYLATLTGNIIIISATTVDQNLHTPMYFFLRNLSILDICYVSVTVPSACVKSLTNNWAISVADCATQIFLVIYFAFVEIPFLTLMACDH